MVEKIGLNSNEWKEQRDLIIKANNEQLFEMVRIVKRECNKRKINWMIDLQ